MPSILTPNTVIITTHTHTHGHGIYICTFPPFLLIVFFNLHCPLPKGYPPHCTSYPGLTVLSRSSVADTTFLDASPSAVGRNRLPSPPPRYPTSRSLNSSTGCVDQGVARVSLPRIPRPVLPREVHHNSVCSLFEQSNGSQCRSKDC